MSGIAFSIKDTKILWETAWRSGMERLPKTIFDRGVEDQTVIKYIRGMVIAWNGSLYSQYVLVVIRMRTMLLSLCTDIELRKVLPCQLLFVYCDAN